MASYTPMMILAILLLLCCRCNAKQRVYFVAAIDVLWDFAPSGYNARNNAPLNSDSDASVFTKNNSQRIGKVYKKSVYREFTDNTYTVQKPRDEYMGIIGPVLKGEKGDSIIIFFKNLASRNFTMHPHTVFYDKASEGAIYDDNTSGTKKLDDGVPPGKMHTYVWIVTEEATPAEGDPRCLTWLYHSHIEPTFDINTGPVGMIQTCKAGSLTISDQRVDADKEFYLLLFVHDENKSWYLDENLRRLGIDPASIDKTDADFTESNLMHGINGRIYGNIHGFDVCQGDRVVWHMSVLGSEPDIHTISFDGNLVVSDHHRTDARALFPAHSGSFLMQAKNAGTWLFECQIFDHLKAGMFALYNVNSTCAKNSTNSTETFVKTREYYIAAEDVEWDYGPSKYNSFDGEWLNKSGSSSATFFERGPNRIGGKYMKARYFEYTNASFDERKFRPSSERYHGFLGPVIKAEVGERIRVYFFNKASINASVHPRGVRYDKKNEGVLFNDKTSGQLKEDDLVRPNSRFTYEWTIPEYMAPTDTDTPCIVWLYSSNVDQMKDSYSGLFGPMVTCKKGSLQPNGLPAGYDAEKFLFIAVIDENESWYLKKNMEKFCTTPNCAGIDKEDDDFKESNKMHQINGQMYGDLEIELCEGKKVLWHGLVLGTEIDIHSIHFAGNAIEVDGNHKDSVMVFPGTTLTFSMTPDNVGKWALTCDVNDHYNAGMKFTYEVKKCSSSEKEPTGTKIRRYYIGIVEEAWDYAPNRRLKTYDTDLDSDQWAGVYTKQSSNRIGRVYKKAMYKEYADATFTNRKPTTDSSKHLGLLGPFIKAEEGDEIIVVLKNMASREYSINPHGVFYSKANEGAKYKDSKGSNGTAVAPGSMHTYHWFVPKRAAPGPNDGPCVTWAYYSSVDIVKDTNSGLVGPLITCRKGTLLNGARNDVSREFALLFTVMDENESWYLDENINKYALEPSKVNKKCNKFKESNKMNVINGFIYSNGPNEGIPFAMFVREKVAWYLLGIGNEVDIHTVHFHGNSFFHRTNSKHLDDVIDIFPGIFDTLEMIPVNPGTWLLHCHVNSHKQAGMETRYNVKTPLLWGGNSHATGLHFSILANLVIILIAMISW